MTDQPARVTPGEITRPARPRPPADQRRRTAGRADRLPRAQGRPAVPDRRRPGHRRGASGRRRGLALRAAPWPPAATLPPRRRRHSEDVAVLRGSDRPGQQPRPVRGPGLAVPGVAHARLGDRHRPAGPAAGAPDRGSWPATRWPTLTAAVLVLAVVPVRLAWPGHPRRLIAAVLAAWRWRWPASFARLVCRPVRGKWRRWHYQRHWAAVMTIARLAPLYQGRLLLPVTGQGHLHRVHRPGAVRLVSGQSADDFAPAPTTWPTGSARCRAGSAPPGPGGWCWSWSAATPWPPSSPPCPIPATSTCGRWPVGRREDGSPWLVRLHGTHVLLAGSTGAGKASLLWGLIRALLPRPRGRAGADARRRSRS